MLETIHMRRYFLFSAFMTVTWAALNACSSDTESVEPGPNTDAGPDRRVNETEDNPEDSGTDSAVEDAGSDADAAPPAPANFMVLRQGTLTGELIHSVAAQVFVDEITQDGDLVRTITLPKEPAGDNLALVQASINYGPAGGGRDGLITRSADGRFVVVAGYSSAETPAPPGIGTGSLDNPRTIGVIDATGKVTITTSINDGFGNASITAATTNDGTSFWSAGGLGSPPFVNIMYSTAGLKTGGVVIHGGPGSNPRTGIGIFDGQLYVASSFGEETGIYKVGMGLPTTENQTITPVVPIETDVVWGFTFLDTDETAGVDTLYVACAPDGIKKYELDGGEWKSVATFTQGLDEDPPGAFGVSAVKEGANVIVLATNLVGNKVLKYVDDGTSTNPTPVPIVTAATFDLGMGYAYRGIAVAPVPSR